MNKTVGTHDPTETWTNLDFGVKSVITGREVECVMGPQRRMETADLMGQEGSSLDSSVMFKVVHTCPASLKYDGLHIADRDCSVGAASLY